MTDAALAPSLDSDNVHIVRVGKRGDFHSDTLDADRVAQLQTAFRKKRWYADGWTRKGFHQDVWRVFETFPERGLVFIGRNVAADAPRFDRRFEPVEIGSNDPQLRTLAGKTGQKRNALDPKILVGALSIVAFLLGAFFVRGIGIRIAAIAGGVLALVFAIVFAIIYLQKSIGSWYLVPGGVAIVRRMKKGADRLVLCTRYDSWSLLRWIHTGKSSYLVLEIRDATGKRYQTGISTADAGSFLGAWQCPHPPPSREQLEELTAH